MFTNSVLGNLPEFPIVGSNLGYSNNFNCSEASEYQQNPATVKNACKNEIIHIENSTACKSTSSEPNNILNCGKEDSYPEELNNLFQPLYCKLCSATLCSVSTKIEHYESQLHQKRVIRWLHEWRKTTGEPLPKVPKIFCENSQKLIKQFPLHCDDCKLTFMSYEHATQHFQGKKHKRILASKCTEVNMKQSNFKQSSKRKSAKSSLALIPNSDTTSDHKDEEIKCDICDISVTSTKQMSDHLLGTKHAKRLKYLGEPPYSKSDDTVLASLRKPTKTDISIYRTPSGNFYCKSCNLTLDDVAVFKRHLLSKQHLKRAKK